MATVNQYFDAVYYINLDRRTDLREYAEEQQRYVGIEAERIAGFDMLPMSGEFAYIRSKGHLGCTIAHLSALLLAKFRRAESVLILEDDATFNFDFRERWEEAQHHIPADWEMLFLGAWTEFDRFSPSNTEPVSGPIHRAHFALCTHAYAVRGSAIDKIAQRIVGEYRAIDQAYAHMMRDGDVKAYIVQPVLAYQKAHFSETDYCNQTVLGK